MLTSKQRDAAEKALAAFEIEADAAKKRAEDEKKNLDLMKTAASTVPGIGGKGGQFLMDSEFGKVRQQRIDIEKANETEQRNRAQEIRQQLIEDAAARKLTAHSL